MTILDTLRLAFKGAGRGRTPASGALVHLALGRGVIRWRWGAVPI